MNNPLKYIDPDGRSGKSVLRLRHIPKMYRAYNTARTVEGLGVMASVSAAFTANQMVNGDRSQEVSAALTGAVANEIVSELNKNLPPDPGWTRGQEKNAAEWAADQLAGHEALTPDGQKPKDPGGDFKPNPKIKPSDIIKVIAFGTAAGVILKEIKDVHDAGQEMKNKEEDKKELEVEKNSVIK